MQMLMPMPMLMPSCQCRDFQVATKIDHKLNFDNHIDEICKKAGQTLNALSKVNPNVDLPKRRMLLNAFFLSQFSCCPLVLMFHSCSKKIRQIGFMKDVYESFKVIRNPPLLNYWKRIILPQFINETYVFLPLRCSASTI